METALIGLVLDSGGRELGRLLSGLAVVVLLGLLLVVSVPVALIAGATPFAAMPPALLPHTNVPPSFRPSSGPAPGPEMPAPIGIGPVELARHYLGVPYVFGGSDPATGLDCSGLVQLVFRQAGFALPRTAQQQYAATARVARDQLQPGDLVFFARTYADS